MAASAVWSAATATSWASEAAASAASARDEPAASTERMPSPRRSTSSGERALSTVAYSAAVPPAM